jgi:hypothetical protein
VQYSHRHLQHLLYRFFHGSRAETPQGSLPACAAGDVAQSLGATRIHPITGWPSLFPTPLPPLPWVGLAASLPRVEEQYGLTTFRKVDTNGLGALCPPGVLDVHDRVLSRPCTRSSAFWRKPVSILGLLLITTFIESAHVFTLPSIQPRLRLMLADTPFPHGSGASQKTVGTVSEGSARVVTFPHILVGYC